MSYAPNPSVHLQISRLNSPGLWFSQPKPQLLSGDWLSSLAGFYILHYTYGNDYTKDGVFTPGKIGQWRFDKRSYMGRIPAKNLELPPKGVPESVRTLIEMINEASSVLPKWETGGQ